MADSTKHYVLRGDKVLAESMTKEEIMTAIVNAIEQGEIGDVDTGFVTTLKEQNGGQALKFWIGTQAQYNAIETPEINVFYIITDDSTEADLEEAIADLNEDVTFLENKTTAMEAAFFSTGDEISNDIWAHCAGYDYLCLHNRGYKRTRVS